MKLKVVEANKLFKQILKDNLDPVLEIEGEVSNFKKAYNGHCYFDLKDADGLVSCIIWSSIAAGLSELKNGDNIEVSGKFDLYVKSGRININVFSFKKQGVGDIQAKFLKLKQKLEKEGYFDESIKKNIPLNCNIIGVVSSGTGAAIKDICSVLYRRNPYIKVYFYASKVQGNDCHLDIAKGIQLLDNKSTELGIESIIVSRGGGSIEDLWGYNEIDVVKAIYNCKTPIISGVGHEIDFTLCDFAADFRAITPSAAAERVTSKPVDEYIDKIEMYYSSINAMVEDKILSEKNRICNMEKIIKLKEPKNLLENYISKMNNQLELIYQNIYGRINRKKDRFENIKKIFLEKEILQILRKGFIIIQNDKKEIINSVSQFKEHKNKEKKLIFHDGSIVIK